jgi:hypothetical protein
LEGALDGEIVEISGDTVGVSEGAAEGATVKDNVMRIT